MQDFESIDLEIEQDLKKPQEYLRTTEIKSIFDDLFKQGKPGISNEGPESLFNENEPLEILNYTLDTKEESIFYHKKSSLFKV